MLKAGEFATMIDAVPAPNAPLIAVNVGTGFNSSLAVPVDGNWTVLPAESGHASLSAFAGSEGFETVESLLSGPGLARLLERQPEDAQRIFSRGLGMSVRNLVLSTGSWSGVYLCGGVVQNRPELIDIAEFSTAFLAEGPMAERLAHVPINRITAAEPTLKALARLSL